MDRQLAELFLQQGRLLERSKAQRDALTGQLVPLQRAAQQADSVLGLLLGTALYLQKNPWIVAVAALGLALIRPQRVWTWGERGLSLWRIWQRLHG